jgi:xanthine/uracil permease
MPSTIEMGQAALPTWRGAIADRVAPPAAKRTKMSEDQVRAAMGAVFFAVATFYVVSSLVRMIRTAKR